MKLFRNRNRNRAEINRANALHSTGPKTEAGKQAARLNASKHGLSGQLTLLPENENDPYHAFFQGMLADLKPIGQLETQIAHRIASDSWRLNQGDNWFNALLANRLNHAVENHVNDQTVEEEPVLAAHLAIAEAARHEAKTLDSFGRHAARLNRDIRANLKLLQDLQDRRRAEERETQFRAAAHFQLHESKQTAAPAAARAPYNPTDDGFVLSLSEIETFLSRETRRREARPYLKELKTAA